MVINPYLKKNTSTTGAGAGTNPTSNATSSSSSVRNAPILLQQQQPSSSSSVANVQTHPDKQHQRSDNNKNNGKTTTTTTTTTIDQLLPEQQSLPKFTSFSQAFHVNDNDDYNDNNDGNMIKQRKDQTEGSSDAATTTTVTTNNSNNNNDATIASDSANDTTTATTTSTSTAFTNDRDYHVLQQQPHVLYVSTKQHGNPILQYIKNVPFTYTRMVPDYIFHTTCCGLYLSIKYHILYRNYIHTRIASLKNDFTIRILLVYIDMDDTDKVLLELNILAVKNNLTLIVGWSEEEMARYIETFKVLQNRDATSIQKSKDTNRMSILDQITDVLTTCKAINKTDAISLMTQFHTVQHIFNANHDELSIISGLGPIKVQRIHDTFHKPFSSKLKRQRQQQKQQQQQQQQQQVEANVNETERTTSLSSDEATIEENNV